MEGANTGTVIIYSGLPQTGQATQAALGKFVLRRAGETLPQSQTKIYMPVDAQGTILGVAFVRYATDAAAQRAIDLLDGTAIDVNHTWSAERTATSQVFATMNAQGQIDSHRIDSLQPIGGGPGGAPQQT